MRLKFRTCSASPVYGSVQPGQEADVPDELAEDLLKGGYAERVGTAPRVIESAAMGEKETAMQPAAKPKRVGK